MKTLERGEAWELEEAKWIGDAAHELLAGEAYRSTGRTRQDVANDPLRVRRAGPFVPPISFPGIGIIVVTDALKSGLESSGLTGLAFLRVTKLTIFRIEYEFSREKVDELVWELSEKCGGEPEDMFLEARHCPKTAAEVGKLWELAPARWGKFASTAAGAEDTPLRICVEAGDLPDLFRPACAGTGRTPVGPATFVSSRARKWLTKHVREWVRFRPLGK